MSIILTIIKIIGIVLLCIIGLVLILGLLFIFLPVAYQVSGDINDVTKVNLKVNASWLFYIILVQYKMEQHNSNLILRIFGIPIQLYPQKKKRKKVHRTNAVLTDKISIQETCEENKKNIEKPVKNENKKYTDKKVEENKKAKKNEKKHIKDKLQFQYHKIVSFFKNFRIEIKKIFYKITDIKTMVQDENNKKAFIHVLVEIKYLLHHYLPRKIKADITFSMGDPAMTGQVLGVVSLLPVIYRYNIQIRPDFMLEKFRIEGRFVAKGHIRLVHIIRSAIHLYRDKNVKILIKNVRN